MGRVPPKALPQVRHDMMGALGGAARIGAGDRDGKPDTNEGSERPAEPKRTKLEKPERNKTGS